jgi:hypothetical protein
MAAVFERFTEEARQVVVLSQKEAVALGHNYIGTEHELLGLLRLEGDVGGVLGRLDVTLERVRSQVVEIVGPGDEVVSGQVPFTPRAKKVLEISLREALSLGHDFIAPEHILLGLMRENEGVAARILHELEVDYDNVREQVIGLLASRGHEPPRAVAPGTIHHAVRQKGAWPAKLLTMIHQLGFEISRDLGRPPDSGDLLALLSSIPGSVADRALRNLGFPEPLDGAIASAREQRQSEALEHEPHLIRAMAIVRERLERAVRERDFETAARLNHVDRSLQEIANESEDVDWREVMPRLRERLGLHRDEPPAQPPAPPDR